MATAIILVVFLASYFENQRIGTASKLSPVESPSHLVIPSISVNAVIQEAGIASSGRMGVPTNFSDVAWYKLGPKPGEIGSAVIDGHLDTARDANAVFVNLGELKIGDEIAVIDKTGKKIRFRVTEKEIYDDESAPLAKIFDQNGNTARLNLITCDGVWNQNEKSYDKRLVVYSERID